jgi:hypothetical protein
MNIHDVGGDLQWNNTLNFVEISDAALQLKWRHKHTHIHHDDVKGPPPPLTFFREECRLKEYVIRLAKILWQCFSNV